MEKLQNSGLFISLEGVDGAGKSTIAPLLKVKLEDLGFEVILSREPGGTPISEQIRALLLDPANQEMDPRAEALLYAAARAQHVRQLILPALQEGKIVISDRFLDSSLAYQGEGRRLGMQNIMDLNDFALHGFRPDLTFYLFCDPEVSAARMNQRKVKDRMDQEKEEFRLRVDQGFETLMDMEPSRFIQVDANGSVESVLSNIFFVTCEELKDRGLIKENPAAKESESQTCSCSQAAKPEGKTDSDSDNLDSFAPSERQICQIL